VFERSEAGDILLTTEKDAIKFEGLKGAAHSPRPIHVVHIEMVIVKGKEEFCARLHSLSRR
jgi:tetraacyldisaccharide-1-P 4'-kinase